MVSCVLPIAAAVVLIVIIIVGIWWLARGRSRAVRGTAGVVRENTLVCSKCNRQFNYQFVPGASLTSLRLGNSRYMKCPLCGKWSVIKIVARPVVPPDQTLTTKKGY
jgi:DNA-directed RNA polymerase subunit RPC12/RpoP